MGRTARIERLHARLAELEQAFDPLALEKMRRASIGPSAGEGWFISRQVSIAFSGKQHRDPDTEKLEDLLSEIVSLREKLREPLERGVVGAILHLEELAAEKPFGLWGDELRSALRAELAKLDHEQTD